MSQFIEIGISLELLQELNKFLRLQKPSIGIASALQLLKILHENKAFHYGFHYGCKTYRLSDHAHGTSEWGNTAIVGLDEEIERIEKKNDLLSGPVAEFLDEEQGKLNFAEREYIGKKETFIERTQREGLLGSIGERHVYDRKKEKLVLQVEHDLSKVEKGFANSLIRHLPQ